MALKNSTVKWVVALLALSLTGLTALQASLLAGAMESKESAFRRSVLSALGRTSGDLALGEAATMFLSVSHTDSLKSPGALMAVYTTDSTLDIETEVMGNVPIGLKAPFTIDGDVVRYQVDSPQHIRIAQRTGDLSIDTVLLDSFHNPGDYELFLDSSKRDANVFSWNSSSGIEQITTLTHNQSGFPPHIRPPGDIASDSGKRQLVARVMSNFINAELVSIEERLDSIDVDSVLKVALREAGIELDYVYAIYSEPVDSARVISSEAHRAELAESDYRVRLFQQDVFAAPAYLSVVFPDHRLFLWRQMTPMLSATVLFTLLIVGSFGYSIRTLTRQRRVSELMVEFINNMTHEMKTPIATVALAAEAIDRDEVVSEPEEIKRFNEMIKSEASRMRGQAEKILQIAALEERKLALSPVSVDLHAILDDAIRTIDLQVANKNGVIKREFKATDSNLQADKLHLINIVYNLLDNANKYSDGAPDITVKTFDSDRGLGFRVTDRGIGIDPKSQKQVFEKYFRATTGNVHDVKGFGLGLSYVKLIVEQHHGEISLHSVPGEMTEVEIILPRIQQDATER